VKFKPDSTIFEDVFTIWLFGPDNYFAYEYTGAKDELLACRETAWLGAHLNMSPVYDVYGPDAVKFLNWACVNRDFSTLKEGSSRHAITCNEKGQMLADGVLIKIGENHFRTYWLAPVLTYRVQTSGMNVQGRFVGYEEYFFQIDGPKSLEILEKACQIDLHDIKFAHSRVVKIGSMDTRVLRLGMSGALAYEVHGPAEDADKVYKLIKEAGKEFGIRPLGSHYYCVNHTQGGYPNQFIHFYYPYYSSGEGLAEFFPRYRPPRVWTGSCADDPENYFVTPYDVGWGYLVNFNHDFTGKKTLTKIAENPPRTPVTLEWDADDVADIFASQWRGTGVEPYERIDRPEDFRYAAPRSELSEFRMNKVLMDGRFVGVTGGRTPDYYHRKIISLAFIDKEYAAEGTDVVVLWGTPGHPQKEVRAKVAAFPYYNEEYRNETFDTEKIPHPKFD